MRKLLWIVILLPNGISCMDPIDDPAQTALAYYGTINKLEWLRESDTWYNRALPWRREALQKEARETIEQFADHIIKRTPPPRRFLSVSLPTGVSRSDLPIFSKRETYIELLLSAASQERVARENRLHRLTIGSKIKIGTGIATSCLGLSQLVYTIIDRVTDDDKTYGEVMAELTTALATISGGAYMAYEGLSNVDAQVDVGKASQLEALLAAKYRELMNHGLPTTPPVDV